MSLFGKKNRDPSQLPTLVYDVTLTVPTSNDSKPQEISFLDLLTNDNRFVNMNYIFFTSRLLYMEPS